MWCSFTVQQHPQENLNNFDCYWKFLSWIVFQKKKIQLTRRPKILVSTWTRFSASTFPRDCSMFMNRSSPCSLKNTPQVGGDSSAQPIKMLLMCINKSPYQTFIVTGHRFFFFRLSTSFKVSKIVTAMLIMSCHVNSVINIKR